MPRTSRLTDALRGRGKVLVFAGAAAALAGVGTASAATASGATVTATVAAATQPTPVNGAAVSAVGGAAVSGLGAAAASSPAAVKLDPAAVPAPFGPASPQAVPAHQPNLRIPVTAGSTTRRDASPQPPATPPVRHWSHLIYDSVTPSAIPAHHQIATYATGGYAVPASQVAGRGPILWIDTRGTDPAAAALDVEPGCATPATAASWVWHKLHHATHQLAIIYTMRSEWPAVQAAVNTLPHHMRTHIRWWIADPTGYNHIVPGASATQWYWSTGYDITTTNPGF